MSKLQTFIIRYFLLRPVDRKRHEVEREEEYRRKFEEQDKNFFANPEMPDAVHFLAASPKGSGSATSGSSYVSVTGSSEPPSIDDQHSLNSLGSDNKSMSDIAMSEPDLGGMHEVANKEHDSDEDYGFHTVLGMPEPEDVHLRRSTEPPAGFWHGAVDDAGSDRNASVHSDKSSVQEQPSQFWRAMSRL